MNEGHISKWKTQFTGQSLVKKHEISRIELHENEKGNPYAEFPGRNKNRVYERGVTEGVEGMARCWGSGRLSALRDCKDTELVCIIDILTFCCPFYM